MKLNYTVKSIRIKSEWFEDLGRKKNVYQTITYKGLNLYFQLYKFRIHNQENEHTFITSISMLRKETGYSSAEVFDLLKKLRSSKVIKLENVSRLDYLLDAEGNIKDKDVLMITSVDGLPLSDYAENDERYIYIPLDLFKQYEEKGLNEKYYALYCLIKKWSNNKERKMWMSIEKMAACLGYDKDYVNKMIYQLNREYLMSSYRRNNNKGGFMFEHVILDNGKQDVMDKFIQAHKENMDKLIARVDKKKKSKKAVNIEDEMVLMEDIESIEGIKYSDEPVEPKLAFGTKTKRKRNGDIAKKEDLDYFEEIMMGLK
jgi:hypothetical protein